MAQSHCQEVYHSYSFFEWGVLDSWEHLGLMQGEQIKKATNFTSIAQPQQRLMFQDVICSQSPNLAVFNNEEKTPKVPPINPRLTIYCLGTFSATSAQSAKNWKFSLAIKPTPTVSECPALYLDTILFVSSNR